MGIEDLLSDPDYLNANLETKQVIFARTVAKTPEFANANAATQQQIMKVFGLAGEEAAEPPQQPQAAEPEFSPVTDVPELSTAAAPPEQNVLSDIKSLPAAGQAGLGVGAAIGAGAGRQEVKAARTAAAAPVVDPRSAGQKWASKTGYGKGEGTTVQQVSEAYQRAKNKGKVSGKIAPGQTLNIHDWMAQRQLEEELASRAQLAEKAEKLTKILGKVPLGSTLMGAGAGLDTASAYEAYKAKDYPLAAMHGLSALGSAASLIPTPPTRLGGGALSLGMIPAIELYKRYKGQK
jgi:hypothetical protein